MLSKQSPKNIVIPIHRPQKFSDFIGHDQIKKTIKTLISASKKRNDILEHILFYGPSGVGKTSLAYIISNELNARLHIVQGPQLVTPADLINSLSLIQKGDIFFIDEIHSIGNSIKEILLSVMEDFKISILIGKDFNSKLTSMNLPKFTFIGATTLLGKISEPLEERFGICLHVDFYTVSEIKLLLKKHSDLWKLNLTDNELELIANASKGIPRIALKILRRIQDFRLINSAYSIEKIFYELNIDKNGLKKIDLSYLNLLGDRPVGLSSITQLLQIDVLTILTKIEPYLLKKGWILKTSRGRCITKEGKKVICKNI